MEKYDAVILADGDYPTSQAATDVLNNARYLVCCDKAGMEFIRRTGKKPDAIVGDGDSMPQEFKVTYSDIYHQVDEQEYNDLTKATRFVVSHLKETAAMGNGNVRPSIAYLGATGKREDHTIGNIALMAFYRRTLGIEPTMITNHGTFVAACGTTPFECKAGQQISIFRLSGTTMSSEGLKWDAYPYSEPWQGTLNEALSDSFTIHSDGEFIIYMTQ